MKLIVITVLSIMIVGCSHIIKVKDPDRSAVYDCDCSYSYAESHPCFYAVLKYNNEQKRVMNKSGRSRSGD